MSYNNNTVEEKSTGVVVDSLKWLHRVWPVIPYHY